MKNTCDTLYTGFKRWRCRLLAGVYYRGVANFYVAAHFTNDVTKTYCDCKCQDASLTACDTSCVDLLTDPNNCGSCYFYVRCQCLSVGVFGTKLTLPQCPTGKCTNGACSFNACAGETCDTFGPCGPGGSCVCASITDGTGFCVDGETPCDGLLGCGTSADCPLGSVCAVATCCESNVCVTTDMCGGYNGPKMLFARNLTAATIGSPSRWVD
jgi:hypothetical protein